MKHPLRNITRRAFVARSSAAVAGTFIANHSIEAAQTAGPFQAMGTRAGEVTDTTAIVWTRLTAAPKRNDGGVIFPLSRVPLSKRNIRCISGGRIRSPARKSPLHPNQPLSQAIPP